MAGRTGRTGCRCARRAVGFSSGENRHELLRIFCLAFGTTQVKLFAWGQYKSFKNMLAFFAFKFVNGHIKSFLLNYSLRRRMSSQDDFLSFFGTRGFQLLYFVGNVFISDGMLGKVIQGFFKMKKRA